MIYNKIVDVIKNDYASGMTQDELAAKYNLSQNHIHQLLSGKTSPKKMMLETFLKMFPKAVINLDGEPKEASKQEKKVDKSLKVDGIKLEIDELYTKLTRAEQSELLTYIIQTIHSKNTYPECVKSEHKII